MHHTRSSSFEGNVGVVNPKSAQMTGLRMDDRGRAAWTITCHCAGPQIRDWDAGDLSVNLHHRPRATTTNGLPSNRRINPDKSKRVQDVYCTSHDSLTEYVIDCRISWSLTASGVSYTSISSRPPVVQA